MTLDTRIYVYDEIDPHSVLHKMREILGATERHPIRDDGPYDYNPTGPHSLGHPAGIGLNAWLLIYYRPDGPLATEDEFEEYEYDDEPYCTQRACYLEVSLDTAYGYNDAFGGCSALHARYLFELGEWLDEQGIAWGWKDEFSGEVYQGDDRYTGITNLLSNGEDAAEWFENAVKPAIMRLAEDRDDLTRD